MKFWLLVYGLTFQYIKIFNEYYIVYTSYICVVSDNDDVQSLRISTSPKKHIIIIYKKK